MSLEKSVKLPAILAPKEEDVQKLLAVQAHIGTTNLEPAMERYIWKRREDGVHIFDLQKTWQKLILAARIIAAIEHPSDIVVISGKAYSQRAVMKFAHFTQANSLAGRYTPGTFTNQIQAKFLEPRLLILSDPRSDHQPLLESSYVNIPTIAFCNTDSPLNHVDVAIPCNTKSKHAVGLMWWLLAREVLYLKNVVPRGTQWEVMPDLFFYRDPTEEKENTEEKGFNANDSAAPAGNQQDPNWNGEENWQQQQQQQPAENWNAQPPTEEWNMGGVPSKSWDAEH